MRKVLSLLMAALVLSPLVPAASWCGEPSPYDPPCLAALQKLSPGARITLIRRDETVVTGMFGRVDSTGLWVRPLTSTDPNEYTLQPIGGIRSLSAELPGQKKYLASTLLGALAGGVLGGVIGHGIGRASEASGERDAEAEGRLGLEHMFDTEVGTAKGVFIGALLGAGVGYAIGALFDKKHKSTTPQWIGCQ